MIDKRTVDMRVMTDWVHPGSRVLDLGCGRGVLLEYLKQKRGIQAVGVDLDPDKASACVKRGLSVFMGDMMEFMQTFPDGHFDFVICSRTLQELRAPAAVIREALRVSQHMLVGFVNYAYWRNRLSLLTRGTRVHNEVFPNLWAAARPTNPLSVTAFEGFCAEASIEVSRRLYFGGDWSTRRRVLPNLRCGYAVYDLVGSTAESR